MSEVKANYLQLEGESRPFNVGLNQSEIYCSLRGVSLKQFNETFAPQALQEEKLTGGELRDFVYSALVAGAQAQGQAVTFSNLDVGNWIDEAEDPQEVAKPLQEMMNQMVRRAERQAERLKNAQAPATETKTGPTKKKQS